MATATNPRDPYGLLASRRDEIPDADDWDGPENEQLGHLTLVRGQGRPAPADRRRDQAA